MRCRARRRQPSTALLVAIGLFAACRKERQEPPTPPEVSHDAAPAVVAPADAGTADASATNKITITLEKPRAPGTGVAKRCAIAGDPLDSDCIGGGEGLVADADGTLYLVAGSRVQRYRRTDGAECRLEPTGAPIELPPENPRPQRMDGPVFFRSGGPAWHLARLGTAIYALDFLGGLFRIDRAAPEPACVDVFGYNSIVQIGTRVLVARKGIEQLSLGKKCTARSAKIDDKARGEVHAIGGALYTAVAGGGDVTRYDGTAKTELGGDTRICSATGLTGCGDGVCIVDSNCMQLVQIAADGTARVIDDRVLFDQRPWHLGDALTLADGRVLLLARHRDAAAGAGSGKDVCEQAVYELPAALFQR